MMTDRMIHTLVLSDGVRVLAGYHRGILRAIASPSLTDTETKAREVGGQVHKSGPVYLVRI